MADADAGPLSRRCGKCGFWEATPLLDPERHVGMCMPTSRLRRHDQQGCDGWTLASLAPLGKPPWLC